MQMRRLPRSLMVAIGTLVLAASACGGPAEPDDRDVAPGPAVCEGGVERPGGTVESEVAVLGNTSNAIERHAGAVWVVQSGTNTVGRYDLETGEWDRDFIDVGAGRNPFDLAFGADGERVYVTNLQGDSVSVASPETGDVAREIESELFATPEGIAATQNWLYVTNVELEVGGDGEVSYGSGSVVVVDRTSFDVRGAAETAFKNPQFARPIETSEGRRVAVSDSGVIETPPDEPARVVSRGGLELWRPNGEPDAERREAYRLDSTDETARIGAPGRPMPTPDGESLYFTSATSPVVFEFDLAERRWRHGTEEPLRIYETDENALHHGTMGPNGILYVTAFNRDQLYLFDTACNERLGGPIDLGVSDSFLEGPHGVALDGREESTDAYFIMSKGNAMGRVSLQFDR